MTGQLIRRTRTLFRRMLAVMAVAAGGALIAVGMVAAQSPSAEREFDTMSVAAGGGPVVATITVSGATQAVVTENLPTGFTYVESSLPDSQVRPDPDDGQRIRFVLVDSSDNPFTYKVTVSQTGTITDSNLTVDRVEYPVTGDDSVTVQESTDPESTDPESTDPESTDPSAKREFDTMSVAAGGGPVVATITVSGATQAVVTENLPTGFTYVESSLPDSQVRPDPDDGQRIRFVLVDSSDNPFTYKVTVSQTGTITDSNLTVDRVEYPVSGDDSVTVQESTDPESTGPSAMREFDTSSVAAGGGPVVATITVSGAIQAVVTENLPTGFTYVESSLPDSQVRPDPDDGQRIRFVLVDSSDNPFTYKVTVSQTGTITDSNLTVDRVEYPVTGHDSVTVQSPSAMREFDTSSVAAGGGPVVATITVSGATQAVVTENLPTGFTYVESSLPDSQVRPDPDDGQRIRFVLVDSSDNPFTYKVTVSQTGTITDSNLTVDRVEYPVTGHDRVTVGTTIRPQPSTATPTATPRRAPSTTRRDPTSTPTPRPATATPTATPTPTPTPETAPATPTPTPTPTATPTPTPTPTAVPAPVATPTPSPKLPSTGDTMPLWLIPLAVLGVLLAIGGVLLLSVRLFRTKGADAA